MKRCFGKPAKLPGVRDEGRIHITWWELREFEVLVFSAMTACSGKFARSAIRGTAQIGPVNLSFASRQPKTESQGG
jgi:hypothetical protein